MANRRGKYMLTQKRKVALRKAQLASARKRRRRVGGGIALGAGILAVTAGGHYAHRQLKGGPKRPSPVAVTTPTIPYRPPMAPPRVRVKKEIDPEVKKAKALKRNQKRRMNYWSGRTSRANKVYLYDKNGNRLPHQPKKVGGTPRKNARATPQERMRVKDQRRILNKMVRNDRKQAQQEKLKNVVSLDSRRRGKKR